jgi:hypothetical protein
MSATKTKTEFGNDPLWLFNKTIQIAAKKVRLEVFITPPVFKNLF